ncbi:hypothetical protein N9Z12_06540, partial [Opitutaceae bacterium]|nr:hypothetical protein [Opitutaceae bacterium]
NSAARCNSRWEQIHPSPILNLMKTTACLVILLSLMLVGCESITTRIKERSAAFENWTPTTQERIRTGELKVGDNSDMVYIVLGSPDSTEDIPREDGSTLSIWNYPKLKQQFMSEETVGYEDHSEYNIATGERIHYQVPNRQKVYQNTKITGMQVILRNGLVTSVRWAGYAPATVATEETKTD